LTDGLHNRIKDRRTALGLTQADLADRVGVTRKTINTVENAIFVPSTILALRIARALGSSVDDVFSLAPNDPTLMPVGDEEGKQA
jgi:putative transcriptional regulator